MAEGIPSATIDAFARTIFREASTYGFQQLDLIRLINELMDLCTAADADRHPLLHSDLPLSEPGSDTLLELPLVGENVTIRAYDASSDAELFEEWLPDKYGRFFALSSTTAQSVSLEALTNGPGNHLGIITLPEGRPIGAMAFLDHSKQQKRAELRKLIGDPAARGQGLAEEATRLWLRYGIQGLELEKIYVSTLQTQIANIKLNEKIGFQVEGLLKNEVLIDGKRCDVLRMGLSAEQT